MTGWNEQKLVVYVAMPSGVIRWVPSITAARKMIASYPWEQQLKMDWLEVPAEVWELNGKGEVDVPF